MRREIVPATAEFARDRPKLQEDFRAAANVSGKPRGLRWKSCDFQDDVAARPRSGEWRAGRTWRPSTIAFEAIAGGGMEDVEAVGNLRAATAILTWSGHDWTTTGRAVFNLEPREVLERYRESLIRDWHIKPAMTSPACERQIGCHAGVKYLPTPAGTAIRRAPAALCGPGAARRRSAGGPCRG